MSKFVHYPPNPVKVDPALIQPASSYKKQVRKVIAGLTLFFVVYVILLVTAVGLAGACIWAGFAVIRFSMDVLPSVLLYITGAMIITYGAVALFFLVKHIFTPAADHPPYRVQLYEKDHPRLFAFIRQLTIDTQTNMPDKVFAIPEVNAAVSYDSSFWSMFWPVRKHLMIGLGLVNTVNLSEFKMVLAHEFGHFSQSSMKLGSYVYTVNRAIYKILYQRQNWGSRMVRKWASISGVINILNIIPQVTIWMMKGVQVSLRLLYRMVNRQYMELSREMEFHADAVAIAVAGSQPAISAMRRFNLSTHCFRHCCEHLAALAAKDSCLKNVYAAQTALMQYIAGLNRLELVNGIPEISDAYLQTQTSSRIQYKDQWASHPSDEEREARYRAAAVEAVVDNTPAWVLFGDAEAFQEQFTRALYHQSFPERNTIRHYEPAAAFIDTIAQQHNRYLFPGIFADYYKNRPFADMTGVVFQEQAAGNPAITELYHPTVTRKIRRLEQNRYDLNILLAIGNGLIETSHFEFDHKKHNRQDAHVLAQQLEAEIKVQTAWLQQADIGRYRFHLQLATQQSSTSFHQLRQMYHHVILQQELAAEMEAQATRIINEVQAIYSRPQVTMTDLLAGLKALKKEENLFKPLLQKMLQHAEVPEAIDATFTADARLFLESNCTYLRDDAVREEEILALYQLTHRAVSNQLDVTELGKKAYLEYAAGLMSRYLQDTEIPGARAPGH
ncbi:M48 family metallopeptidase [Chitinophaga sp. XS-30]|uniref:M48 family metallopeptidase n=1 Tax=Chitinophaga sp. XS-30 TaxID=2604421 RepID=UPI00143E0AA3|nr:M48 family metallopeptidase [Chitinophaga sp. XS-30]